VVGTTVLFVVFSLLVVLQELVEILGEILIGVAGLEKDRLGLGRDAAGIRARAAPARTALARTAPARAAPAANAPKKNNLPSGTTDWEVDMNGSKESILYNIT
jgi:hypothetical protein